MGEKFTIQISKNLVNQLAGENNNPKNKTRKLKPKPKPKRDPHTTTGWNTLHKTPIFLPGPTLHQPENKELEAIKSVLDDSKKVLEKLKNQEDTMVQEVSKKAKDLHDKEFKIPDQKTIPCVSEKDACLKCYKENMNDPLKCANFVQDFADCARRFRQVYGTVHK